MAHRVLCCSGSLEGGGSERQLWQLATGLEPDRLAAEIYLIFRRGMYLAQVPERIPIIDFESSYQPRRGYWPGRMRRAQIRHLTQTLRTRRIACVYDRTFHMTLLTAAACRRANVPRLSVIVSPPSRDLGQSRERYRWFKRRLLAAAYRAPQCWPLAVADAVADDAAQYYGIPRQRFRTLPSPIDVAAIAQAAEAADAAQSLRQAPAGCFKISVVGRLSAEKGQALALEALAHLQSRLPGQPLRLSLIGDGPARQSLQRLAEQLGVAEQVHFTGHVLNPYPWMAASDVICIPSHYEGLPNVALEAMCLGIPLLATECGGAIVQLCGAQERGVVAPGEARALAAALQDRWHQAAAWHARAAAAQVWVRRHHGLQPWLEQMHTLLEQRIEARKNP